MIRLVRRFRQFSKNERGATVVEFAIVIVPFTILLLGLFDFGYRAYIGSLVEGTVHRAARRATIGNQTADQIDAYIREQVADFNKNGTLTITKKSYSDFSGVGKDEKYVDSNANNKYDAGVDCYFDDNDNGVWDSAATSGTTGVGGSDDLVYYTVKVSFPRIVPLDKFLGWSATEDVSSSTVLRNQPYGSQAFPSCKK